jgi:AcrR family transcriptional regulator
MPVRAATRRDVLAAADVLFRERGYAGTSVNDLAEAAGVAVQSIYNAFGSKRGVLAALAEGIAGYALDPRIRTEPDAAAVLALVAARLTGEHERTSELRATVREAAAADGALAELERDRREGRLAAYRELARELKRRGALAGGVAVDEAALGVAVLGDPDTYRLLRGRGWTPERYERWLARSLRAQLLQ